MRSKKQQIVDFITFPLRAMSLFYEDKWGLSSQATERYDYVLHEVRGYCLDVGCGPHNRFIKEFCNNQGIGIDVYKYDGLTDENIIIDMTHLPYSDDTFDTATFIANINHIPENQRDDELKEAYRVLKRPGNIVVTMGNPIAEILVHKVVALHDRVFNTKQDVDSERGMVEGEEYFLTDLEIKNRLTSAGFSDVEKKFFLTQWGFNHLFVAYKR